MKTSSKSRYAKKIDRLTSRFAFVPTDKDNPATPYKATIPRYYGYPLYPDNPNIIWQEPIGELDPIKTAKAGFPVYKPPRQIPPPKVKSHKP